MKKEKISSDTEASEPNERVKLRPLGEIKVFYFPPACSKSLDCNRSFNSTKTAVIYVSKCELAVRRKEKVSLNGRDVVRSIHKGAFLLKACQKHTVFKSRNTNYDDHIPNLQQFYNSNQFLKKRVSCKTFTKFLLIHTIQTAQLMLSS